ncbi:group 1 truncated hemoglobin [Mycobacterium sp. 94-17]|uniref:group I truncated hemoglobin n=1 Tax=Mycobacterium sp. 94-17 TaxID=2986147 RepID=UPI002D1F4853|nr:group 1 truncated hemoglobin [Mycobacterium sp. 94-17]MEB4210295.1 group 1 truncated hemoglobin [Mycobacterium sp. 94-17]
MTSIYQKLGGEAALIAVVDDFYKRVLADFRLSGYFHNTDTDDLKRRQVEFFAATLGGPQKYTGLSMAQAHRGRNIGRRHFYRVLDHLTDALVAACVPPPIVLAIISAIAPLADDIVTEEPCLSSVGSRPAVSDPARG